MKSNISRWVRPVWALFVLATPLAACAAGGRTGSVGEDVRAEAVTVGIDGTFKVGRWTPLQVTLGSSRGGPSSGGPDAARLEIDAPDPDGSVVTFQGDPVALQPAGSNVLTALFKMGRLEGTIRVRVVAEGGILLFSRQLQVSANPDADVPAPLRLSVFLVGYVHGASDPSAESGGAGGDRVRSLLSGEAANSPEAGGDGAPRLRIDVVEMGSFAPLPADPVSLGSLDAIVLDGRVDVDPARSRAIESWVRSGGHLVLALGKAGKNLPQSRLASWLPIKADGTMRLTDLSAIESYCRQSSRIMSASDEPIDVARLSVGAGAGAGAGAGPGEAKSLITSLEGPLLCRASYGLGRVTVFAINVDHPYLLRWRAMSDLLRRLLDVEEPHSKRSQSGAARLTQTGISELATQLDATQDDFPEVARVTTWTVMGLLIALLIVIGPLDFVLVHKILGRPHLTWLTFPLFAAAAAAAAIWWGTSAKGERLLTNQLDIVDVDVASGTTRSHSRNLFYSPENRRFNVSGEPDALTAPTPPDTAVTTPADAALARSAADCRMAWHGKPEASFGGMYRGGGAEFGRPSYAIEPHARARTRAIASVPIAVWSSKCLEAEWEGKNPHLVDSQLESPGPSRLAGTLRHHFPEPIEDWVVAYGQQIYYPATDPKTGEPLPLPPEVPWSPQSALQRELSGYLTGTTREKTKAEGSKNLDEIRVEHADYDPLNRDPVGIMRMLTFHREAGGTSYTGLENGALRNFDWTPLLELDRAVLVGRIRRPVMHWKTDGKRVDPDRNVTLVRLVLPVRKSAQQRFD